MSIPCGKTQNKMRRAKPCLVHHHPTFWEKEKERVPNYLSPRQDSPRPGRRQSPLHPHCLISLLTLHWVGARVVERGGVGPCGRPAGPCENMISPFSTTSG